MAAVVPPVIVPAAAAAAAAAAVLPPGGPGLIPSPPPFVFSLTPASGNAQMPLNMETDAGRKIHSKVTQPLTTEFDGDKMNLLTFVLQICERISMAGWDSTCTNIFEIPINVSTVPDLINLRQRSTVSVTVHCSSRSPFRNAPLTLLSPYPKSEPSSCTLTLIWSRSVETLANSTNMSRP